MKTTTTLTRKFTAANKVVWHKGVEVTITRLGMIGKAVLVLVESIYGSFHTSEGQIQSLTKPFHLEDARPESYTPVPNSPFSIAWVEQFNP